RAEVRIENQMQVAVEVGCVAAMTNDAVAVPGFFIKAESHAVKSLIGRELAGMHQLRGLGTENLYVAEPAALQVGNHEVANVGGRDGHATGGGSAVEFEGGGRRGREEGGRWKEGGGSRWEEVPKEGKWESFTRGGEFDRR